EYSMSQIAVMCGFMDLSHFSKTFKKIMQVPPSQFDFWDF
ncbi:MAG: AraC family transcriptional regulator, partial [Clostridia bacterium]|nr:AraC family transcriptional regulator [Clostridia bacterium]